MIHNRNQNTRFRSTTDCFYCIVMEETKIFFNLFSWVQETCLLIQAALLRQASRSFHRGLHECFEKDFEHLFDTPQHSRIDNDVSGLSPIYIPVDNVISWPHCRRRCVFIEKKNTS